jgi:hypothetical protein
VLVGLRKRQNRPPTSEVRTIKSINLDLALEAPNFLAAESDKKWLPIRPCTGSVWIDFVWLSLMASLDQHMIPSVLGPLLTLDILIPWMVISFVVGSTRQVFFIWFFGSFFLETAANAPKGMYLCAMWIVMCILLLIRKTLSWKLAPPWLATFFVSSFWVCNFESLIIFLREDSGQLNFFYFFHQMFRVLLSCLIGMTLAQPWMRRFQGDTARGEKSSL